MKSQTSKQIKEEQTKKNAENQTKAKRK